MTTFKKMLEAIQAYLSEEGSNRKIAAAKGRITRFANELGNELGAVPAREKILQLLGNIEEESPRLSLLKNRFTPGSFYMEGDRVFGWWDEAIQIQAEELPFDKSIGYRHEVTFSLRQSERFLWMQRGFHEPEELPVTFWPGEVKVSFPVKRSLFFLEYGYALPCSLPYRWDNSGFWVTRSIISAGWWSAYRWWEGCQWWYYERHPEWFTEMDWWGDYDESKPVWYPAPDEYSAVLGGTAAP